MRAILCSVAVLGMLTLSQPASACGLDGMFGAHRFNPFLGLGVGAGDSENDSSSQWSDDQQDYSDQSNDYANDTSDQDTTDDNPEDFQG